MDRPYHVLNMQFMNLEGVNIRPNYIQRIKGLPVSIYLRTICFVSFFLFSFFVSKVNAQTATIQLIGSNSVCVGDVGPTIRFTGNNGNGAPEYKFTYTINGNGPFTTAQSNNDVINLIVPTGTAGSFAYDLRSVEDDGGNGAPVSLTLPPVTVTVVALPTPDVEITAGTLPLCYTGTTSVTIRSDITGSAYQWYYTGFPPGPGTQIAGATNRSLTLFPGDGGYYTVRVTNAAGCQGFSAAFQVTQMSTPAAINGSHNTTHDNECAGFNPPTLNLGTVSGGSGGYTYQWQSSSD